MSMFGVACLLIYRRYKYGLVAIFFFLHYYHQYCIKNFLLRFPSLFNLLPSLLSSLAINFPQRFNIQDEDNAYHFDSEYRFIIFSIKCSNA